MSSREVRCIGVHNCCLMQQYADEGAVSRVGSRARGRRVSMEAEALSQKPTNRAVVGNGAEVLLLLQSWILRRRPSRSRRPAR